MIEGEITVQVVGFFEVNLIIKRIAYVINLCENDAAFLSKNRKNG